MITELSMTNFKSWRETGPMRFAPITAFFGTNSSGKTSILQLLLMLKQTVESADRRQVIDFGGEPRSFVHLGSFSDVIHRHADTEPLAWDFAWRLAEEADDLCIENPENPDQELARTRELRFRARIRQGALGKNGLMTPHAEFMRYTAGAFHAGIRTRQDSSTALVEPESNAMDFAVRPGMQPGVKHQDKCYAFPDSLRSVYRNFESLSDFELQFENLFARIRYLGPLREYPDRHYVWDGSDPADMGKRGEKAIHALLASKSSTDIPAADVKISEWLKKLGLIESFEIKASAGIENFYKVWVRRNPKSPEVSLADVGFGVSQILPVLTLCFYAPKGSILILEHPEIHLHPSAQAGLADVLIDAIKAREVQIIVESHSEHLLRRLQRRVAEEALSPDDIALYFCDMLEGESTLDPLMVDSYGNISNWPEDFFGDQFGEIAAMSEAGLQRKIRDSA